MVKSVVTIILAAMLIFAISPSDVMAQKLTGGAEWTEAGSVDFSVTANAVMTAKGVKGHIQYTREDQSVADLIVHANVECFGVAPGGGSAVAAGPAVAQLDPSGAVSGWLIFAVREGGTGAGDSVRVWFANETAALNYCSNPSLNTAFPGIVREGNFTIREY